MRSSRFSPFWGVFLAFLVITVIGLIVKSAQRQEAEDHGVDSICQKMEASGGGSYADCKKQMKAMGY